MEHNAQQQQQQQAHHQMRIPKRDVTYIVLSLYLLTLTSPIRLIMDHIQVNLIQLKTFELKLDFAEYIQRTDVQIVDLCCHPLYMPSTG